MRIRVLNKNGVSGWLEKAIWVVLCLGIAAILTMPQVVRYLLVTRISVRVFPQIYRSMVLLMEYTAILGVVALWQLRMILHNINTQRPFILNNVHRLQAIAVCSALLAMGYGIGVVYIDSFLSGIMCVVFLVIAFSVMVCAELFRHAVEYKEENEQTI